MKKLFSWFQYEKEPHSKHFGMLSEWMSKIPNDLNTGAVGLWQVISTLKKDFRLTRQILIERVRETLLALFERGAQPVVASRPGVQGWRLEDSYGNTPEEKAEAIIQEWLNSGEDPVFWKSLWFALSEDITEFPEPGKIYPKERFYPGEVYILPYNSASYGMRVSDKHGEIIDFANIPGGPSCLQVCSEKE